ncbi:MAG: hypothetical protein ACFFG0_08100 [Candidatus Thorarchaeota archaeon]
MNKINGMVSKLGEILSKYINSTENEKEKFILVGIETGGTVLVKQLNKILNLDYFIVKLNKENDTIKKNSDLLKDSNINYIFIDDAVWSGKTKDIIEKNIKDIKYKYAVIIDPYHKADFSVFNNYNFPFYDNDDIDIDSFMFFTYSYILYGSRYYSDHIFSTFKEAKTDMLNRFNGKTTIIKSNEQFINSSFPHASYTIKIKTKDDLVNSHTYIKPLILKDISLKYLSYFEKLVKHHSDFYIGYDTHSTENPECILCKKWDDLMKILEKYDFNPLIQKTWDYDD